jgi:hypothetical protein
MKIEFDAQEVVACRQLLEVALKTVGKNAVPAYIALENKFQQALNENDPPQKGSRKSDPFEEDDD